MDKRALAATFRERLQTAAGRGARRRRRLPARHRHRPLGAQPVPRPRGRPAAARRDAAPDRRGARRHRRLAAQPLERPRGPAGGDALGADRVGRGPGRRLADRGVAARGRRHEAALRAVEPARHARPLRGRAPSPRPAPGSPRTCSAASGSARWTSRSPCRCRPSRTSPPAPASGAAPTPRRAAGFSATWPRPAPRPIRRCRLHLFDGRTAFAAPFTVFGRIRAAVYLGEAYLVVTSADQVGALSRLFDSLVRRAIVDPERVHERLNALADATA